MHIGVLGLGATGGLFATLLAQHNEVHVLARGARGAHALTSGLRVTGHADLEVALPAERVHLLDAPGATPPTLTMDAVLLCVKAHQVEEVSAMLPGLLAPEGVVAYLGNGLGVVERLARAVPGHVVAASSTHGAMRADGSTSTWTGRGEVALGAWPGGAPPEAVETLADASPPRDYRRVSWTMLADKSGSRPCSTSPSIPCVPWPGSETVRCFRRPCSMLPSVC
ncbi:MAG: hypothetical protein CM15mP128_0730 [Methanobacteriota archaeon]|nr:MAG: hypothetical protein CM15mP128_0730 [Euryarchaeota archaeon]